MIGKGNGTILAVACLCCLTAAAKGGPYKEAGIPGFIDPNNHCRHANPIPEAGGDANAMLNTIFRGWASTVIEYAPAPNVDGQWQLAENALGPVTGQVASVVSLGDLNSDQINQGIAPGQITLYFADANQIRDVNGYDFVVFENGFVAWGSDEYYGYKEGQLLAELGYVEVSSDGIYFARFPSVSLTPALVGSYGTIDITNVHNLAGKHVNANGRCYGTPFDLKEVACEPNVLAGLVDVNNIRYVRIVDVPGSGDFTDEAFAYIDPCSYPTWDFYDVNHPIYDCWVTWGSGGFDLEAIGVLHNQEYSADINLDGIVDWFDFALFASAWLSHFGQAQWIERCDLAGPKDHSINVPDLADFSAQWLMEEVWSAQKF